MYKRKFQDTEMFLHLRMRFIEYIHCNDTLIMNLYTYERAGMRKGNAFIRGTHAQCMSQEMQTLLILTNRPEVAVGA